MKFLQIIKPSVTALLLVCLGLPTFSQKLSEIQKGSLRAPVKVKIDGKLNEWGNTFQAYNNNTNVFYTMANDDKNLYLIIKSADQMNNSKIIAGGINFTINTADKKNGKDAYMVVFPLIDMATLRNQLQPPTARPAVAVDMSRAPGPGGMFGQPDSARIVTMRKQVMALAKEIKILGFTADIPDTILSVYNEYSIKAAIDFDNQGSMVYEMAIPLKYLHLSTENAKEFAYNVKLNGLNISSMMPPGANVSAMGPPAGGGFGGGGGGMGGGMGGGAPAGFSGGPPPSFMQAIQNMISPTDFWGKYLLAK